MKNLLRKIIEFIKKILFGKKSKKIENKKTLQELSKELEELFSEKEKQLQEFSAKKIAEIKHSYSKATSLLETIKSKSLEEKPNEKLNKAAETSKKQVEQQLQQLLEKINPEKTTNNIEETQTYVNESLNLLITNIVSFRKSITYTSFYLKEEMSSLGEALQEIINAMQEIKEVFEKEKTFFEYKNFKEMEMEFRKEKENIAGKRKAIEELNKKIEELERLKIKQKESLEKAKQSEEAKKLQELQKEKTKLINEKQQLRTEVSALIANVDKPLQRFKALAQSGRVVLSKDRINLIDSYTGNPLIALKADPKGELLKEIIREIIATIEQGKLELKPEEKNKKLEALKKLLEYDFFEKIFWRMNEVQKLQIELDKQIAENIATKIIQNEEEKLKEIEEKIIESKKELEISKKQEQNAIIKKEELKKQIEGFSEKALKKIIEIEEKD